MGVVIQRNMGKVYTDLTITNRGDQFLAKRVLIDEREVRSLTLKRVLVDTGQGLFSLFD